jgi:hypothetical protein
VCEQSNPQIDLTCFVRYFLSALVVKVLYYTSFQHEP